MTEGPKVRFLWKDVVIASYYEERLKNAVIFCEHGMSRLDALIEASIEMANDLADLRRDLKTARKDS